MVYDIKGGRRATRTTKPLLSVEETAVLLGESRSAIYRSIKRGDLPIPHFRINGRLRIPRRGVERFLAGELPGPLVEDRPDVVSGSPILGGDTVGVMPSHLDG